MVKRYIRKTQMGSWDENTMKKAMEEVMKFKKSVKGTAVKYGISPTTLKRHIVRGSHKKHLGRFRTFFSSEQELELLDYVSKMGNILNGLSRQEFLKLAFLYAEKCSVSHQFKSGSAGLDWYKGFEKRHPSLMLKKWATKRSDNEQFQSVFDLLFEERSKQEIDASCESNTEPVNSKPSKQNIDASCLSNSETVDPKPSSPLRVFTKTWKRQIEEFDDEEYDNEKEVLQLEEEVDTDEQDTSDEVLINIKRETDELNVDYCEENRISTQSVEQSQDKRVSTQCRNCDCETLVDAIKAMKVICQASENEYAAFGKSIGLQLQNMPIELAVQLQTDIQALVAKSRLEYLKKHISSD